MKNGCTKSVSILRLVSEKTARKTIKYYKYENIEEKKNEQDRRKLNGLLSAITLNISHKKDR